ncbi:MAG: aminotransferase class I/II-fold pyridoxal phosphate-dependent enzyme [Alphaproteobacteria bacterium]|nr:aminotransferase class I/II-fold pyridoxal phosphate-dependent enzyme [Alphaproteobacteria bacterium]
MTGSNRKPGFQTRAIHHGYNPAEHHRAVTPPIYMTSTFAFESVDEAEAVAEQAGAVYAREHNPTTAILEARLAELEGAEAAVVVASGMAAVGTLLLSLLSQGDAIVVHSTLYSNTFAMAHDGLPRFGIKVIPVDLANPANLDAVLDATVKLVYFETPVNPTAQTLDIAAIAERAHAHGARVVVDSTFASPAVQRPIEHGADIVLHSLTKYINGHGDLLGGALIGDAATIARIRGTGLRYITGATLSPMAAFLVIRGLKTLKLRMDVHGANALAIARMLEAHPKVAWVRYPFLESNPGYATARRQMSNGSAMLAFGLKTGFEGARRMMDGLSLIARAVSLGDAESLIMHPASLTYARRRTKPEAKLATGVSEDLVRLSVGLEDLDDLLADIEGGLERV